MGSLFTKLPLIFLPLLFLRKTRFVFLFVLFGSLSQLLFFKPPIENLPSCELSGLFTPKKLSKYAGFFDVKIILNGTFQTELGTFELSLFDPKFDPYSSNVSFLVVQHTKGPSGSIIKVLNHRFFAKKTCLYAFRVKMLLFFEKLIKISSDSKAEKLFFALFTGQIEDRLMMLQFKDFGLSHLLVLSGFHLQLVLAFCNFFLKRYFRFNIRQSMGLFILFIYCLFIGAVPSIIRAFSSLLFGFLLTKETFQKKPLTIFGLSLMVTCLFCPNKLSAPGFVLSFVATFGITSFDLIKYHVLKLFQKDKDFYSKIIKTWLNHFLCQLWITIFSLFPLLFYFQTFHLESIFYNLFMPHLISIGMWITASCLLLKWISKDLGNFFLKLVYQVYDELFFIIKKPLVKNWEFLSQSFGLVFLISACVLLLQLVFFLERKKTKAR